MQSSKKPLLLTLLSLLIAGIFLMAKQLIHKKFADDAYQAVIAAGGTVSDCRNQYKPFLVFWGTQLVDCQAGFEQDTNELEAKIKADPSFTIKSPDAANNSFRLYCKDDGIGELCYGFSKGKPPTIYLSRMRQGL